MRGKATVENIRACNSNRFTRKLNRMWRFCRDCRKYLTNANHSATCRERAVFGRKIWCGAYTPNFYRTGLPPREVWIPISRNLIYTLYIHRNDSVYIQKKDPRATTFWDQRKEVYRQHLWLLPHKKTIMLRFFELFIYVS